MLEAMFSVAVMDANDALACLTLACMARVFMAAAT